MLEKTRLREETSRREKVLEACCAVHAISTISWLEVLLSALLSDWKDGARFDSPSLANLFRLQSGVCSHSRLPCITKKTMLWLSGKLLRVTAWKQFFGTAASVVGDDKWCHASMFSLVFLKCMGIVWLFEQLLSWESEAPLSLHDDRKLECGWTVEVSRMGVDWNGICNCHSCWALCVEIPYLVTLPVVGFFRCRLLSSLVRTPCAALMVLLLAQNLDFSFLWCQPV